MDRFGRFIAVLVLVLVAAGLSCGTGINRGDFSLISIGEEWELGNQLAGDIASQMRILSDPEIQRFITDMGQQIVTEAQGDTPVADRPWAFHVIEDETINAFNIPGGHVYFHSGLIAEAGDYAELMGVMGHEVAHGLARHGVENLTKQYGISIVASLVLGQNPEQYQEILASILAGGAVSKFSRGAENEADRLGVAYMYEAGVDPMGMVDFFQILLDIRPRRPSAIEQFFSSHPLTEERIANVKDQVQDLPPKPLTREDAQFQSFKQAVARSVGG